MNEKNENGKKFEDSSGAYPVAHLSSAALALLQQFESQLREDTQDDLVLIAYGNEQKSLN